MTRPRVSPWAGIHGLALYVGMAGAVSSTAADAPRPPRPPEVPDYRERFAADEPPAIFLYRVDASCRVTATRKLQGPASLSWREVQEDRLIEQRRTVWRMVDGMRSQLEERRIKLRGELVQSGELVCHVRPAGQVLEAWVERHDDSPARRRAPRREPVQVTNGRLADLGTYSLTIDPQG